VADFSAVVEAGRGGGHFVQVPPEVAESINARHLMKVTGKLAETPYRSNLVKSEGRFYLGLHKATLRSAGKDTGDEVVVTMEIDRERD
jgi:Domain of unknown function (DUF1905)